MQTVQNAIFGTTKESREFYMIKRQSKVVMMQTAPRNMKTSPYKDAKNVVPHMGLVDVWHLERTVKKIEATTT